MSRRSGWLAVVGTIAVAVAGCGGGGPAQGPSQTGTPTKIPVRPVATCPTGTEPNTAGPASQDRPSLYGVSPAVDGQSGVVVVVDTDAGTWTFDVCTNTWAKPVTKGSPPSQFPRLVYDAASDLTYAFGDGDISTYDAESATWNVVDTAVPELAGAPASQRLLSDPTHRVVYLFTEAGELKSYDLANNRWTRVEQGTVRPPSLGGADVAVFDPSVGRIILKVHTNYSGPFPTDPPPTPAPVYPQTWAFDPATGAWVKLDAYTPEFNFGYGALGTEVAYDPASRKTVVFSDGRLATFDATTGEWTTATPGKGWPDVERPDSPDIIRHTDGPDERIAIGVGPLSRLYHGVVHDPVNGRVLVLGGNVRTADDGDGWRDGTDVWAYDIDTNTWTLVVPAQPD